MNLSIRIIAFLSSYDEVLQGSDHDNNIYCLKLSFVLCTEY